MANFEKASAKLAEDLRKKQKQKKHRAEVVANMPRAYKPEEVASAKIQREQYRRAAALFEWLGEEMQGMAEMGAEQYGNDWKIQRMQKLGELLPFFVEYCQDMEQAADNVARIWEAQTTGQDLGQIVDIREDTKEGQEYSAALLATIESIGETIQKGADLVHLAEIKAEGHRQKSKDKQEREDGPQIMAALATEEKAEELRREIARLRKIRQGLETTKKTGGGNQWEDMSAEELAEFLAREDTQELREALGEIRDILENEDGDSWARPILRKTRDKIRAKLEEIDQRTKARS